MISLLLLTRQAIKQIYNYKEHSQMCFSSDIAFTRQESKSQEKLDDDFIKKLFPSPIIVQTSKNKENYFGKVSQQKQNMIFTLEAITTILIQKDIRPPNLPMNTSMQASVQKVRHDQIKQNRMQEHEQVHQRQIVDIKIARKLTHQQKVQDLLNSGRNNIHFLNSMLYDVFNFLFISHSYLYSLTADCHSLSSGISSNLLRIIYEGQMHQMRKFCEKDKQSIIRKIIILKYSKNSCEAFVADCMKASESKNRSQIREFYEGLVNLLVSKDTYGLDIDRIVKHINHNKQFYDDVYK